MRSTRIYGVSAGKRDQIEIFFKKKFLSKIDVDLIIWSRTFIISKKNFLSIWSLFPALTPYGASSIETGHLAKNFNFLFINKIYSTISIQCSSVISPIFQKIARCPVSIDEAPYTKILSRLIKLIYCKLSNLD